MVQSFTARMAPAKDGRESAYADRYLADEPRADTQATGPWDTSMFVDDDGEYYCRVLLASDGVHFVPGAKVFYRATTCTRLSYIGRSKKKQDAQLLSMQLHVKFIRSLEDSDRVR